MLVLHNQFHSHIPTLILCDDDQSVQNSQEANGVGAGRKISRLVLARVDIFVLSS